jgi:hypothetical protein
VVSSYDGLFGTMALYVDVAGETCDAANACERYIRQLRQMIDAVSTGNAAPLSLWWRSVLWVQRRLRMPI